MGVLCYVVQVVTEFQDNPALEQHVTAVERTENETRSTGCQVSHASLRRSLLHLHCRALLVSRVGCAPLFTPPPFVRPPHPSKLSTWTPALPPRPWSKRESFLLVVVDDYYRYTTVFPMAKKSDVTTTLIQWLLATETTRVRRSPQQPPTLPQHVAVDSGGVGVGGTGVGGAGCERAGAEVTDTGDASPEGVGIVGPGTGGAISWGVGLEGAGTGGAISERTGVEIAGTGGSSSGGARFGGVGGRGACSEETGAGEVGAGEDRAGAVATGAAAAAAELHP
ncbi:unnamed protein product [Closterium sp. NIES-54]